MSITLLLVDNPVGFTGAPEGTSGLLGLPLGHRTVIAHLFDRLESLAEKDILVTSASEFPDGYAELLQAEVPQRVRLIGRDELAPILNDLETSDSLLIVDARFWLVDGYDTAGLRQTRDEYRGATFGVAVGSDIDGAREVVEHDRDGRVRRVQRFYNAVSWPEVASSNTAYALLPGRCIRDAAFSTIPELRVSLAARGMLTYDVPILSDTLDLTNEGEFLALHERFLNELTEEAERLRGYRRIAPSVLVAEGAQVQASARLVGPVLVQRGAVIEAGAVVIGPTLVGAGSRIESDGTVAQSVVLPGSVVAAGETVRHCVMSQACSPAHSTSRSAALSRSRSDALLRPSVLLDSHDSSKDALAGKGFQLAVKRIFDVLVSATALLLLAPLLLVVAILVKLDSPGPLFFAHRRERKGGKDFPCVKFRTMVANAHALQRELYKQNEIDGPQFKMREDPRVTRVGRWLRATNLDELPQLFNVLVGHMSLVGPRPSPFRENQICVPWRRARLSVRPGITGLWQVCRDDDRSRADFHQWIYYDIAYVRHFSFWLDMKILFATIITLGGRWSVPISWMIRRDARMTASYGHPVAA